MSRALLRKVTRASARVRPLARSARSTIASTARSAASPRSFTAYQHVLELAGLVLIAWGVALIWRPAGIITAGALLILFSRSLDPYARKAGEA